MTTNIDEMANIAKDYFFTLFSTRGGKNLKDGLEGVNKCISKVMNRDLLKTYKIEKSQASLKEMAPLKAIRDGFLTFFFQKICHIIGNEVGEYCLNRGIHWKV